MQGSDAYDVFRSSGQDEYENLEEDGAARQDTDQEREETRQIVGGDLG